MSRLEKNETKTFEAETARKSMILPQNLVRLGKKEISGQESGQYSCIFRV